MSANISGFSVRPMLGHLLTRVVFVEGPGNAGFTADERRLLLKYVETGGKHVTDLHDRWRARQQPPLPRSCAFSVTTQRVAITLDPGSLPKPADPKAPTQADFDAIDGRWIDAALEALGYTKTDTPRLGDRITALAADATLEQVFGGAYPADAYVVFLTKYPCHSMAYARADVGFCTLCPPMLDEVGWNDQYDLVVAHVTGHIFGAPDEYVAANLSCDPNRAAGPFGIPNVNCEAGNPHAVKCLMRHADLELCDQTPLHWGWWDGDGDGVVDLLAPPTIDSFNVYDPVERVWTHGVRAASPGWTLNIKGRNAWDARAVTFGGVPSPLIWRVALDEIAVTVPDGVSGIVTIAFVTRSGATSASFDQSWFLVAEPVPLPTTKPVVFGLTPPSGASGTAVKILGASLFGPTSVKFGGVQADLSGLPPSDGQSSNQIEITAPAGPTGSVPVVVTTPNGSSDPSVAATFMYT
jgi:hypothetical protein